jgi:aldehyde dehydrogenase (NAD+)
MPRVVSERPFVTSETDPSDPEVSVERTDPVSEELWTEERMLIDGDLVPAKSGRTFANVNPATEEEIGVVADGDGADMGSAIAAARVAFDDGKWSRDVSFRTRCLRQLNQALTERREDFGRTLVSEIGTPVMLLGMAQFDTPVGGVNWVADLADGYKWESSLGTAQTFGIDSLRTVVREPVGVVGAITPWNYPVQINLAKIAPALAAGNTVVLKPAPDSPWAATLIGQLVAEKTDIPAGVFNVVTSSDHSVGEALASDPRVDMVSFTGSTATGRRIMSVASSQIKKVFLELGGKSAAIVLDDADLGSGVAGYWFTDRRSTTRWMSRARRWPTSGTGTRPTRRT